MNEIHLSEISPSPLSDNISEKPVFPSFGTLNEASREGLKHGNQTQTQ
jgi:hypothetical protein